MAEAMVRSVATAPQACVFLTLDVTPTVELVGRLRENRHFDGLRVTPLALVARAVVLALRDHAALNSSWDDATAEVVTKHYVNLGIAVAGPSGLVVPNIKDAQELTLPRSHPGARGPDRARPCRALHASRSQRRHDHRDERRCLRRRRRCADPEPGGGRHPCRGRHCPATVDLRERGRACAT